MITGTSFCKVKTPLGLHFQGKESFISWQVRGGDTKGNLFWECSVPVRASFLAERLSSKTKFSSVYWNCLAFRPTLGFMEALEMVLVISLHNMGNAKCRLSAFMAHWFQISILETWALVTLNITLSLPFLKPHWPGVHVSNTWSLPYASENNCP